MPWDAFLTIIFSEIQILRPAQPELSPVQISGRYLVSLWLFLYTFSVFYIFVEFVVSISQFTATASHLTAAAERLPPV